MVSGLLGILQSKYTAEPGSERLKDYISRFLEQPECVETLELYAQAYSF